MSSLRKMVKISELKTGMENVSVEGVVARKYKIRTVNGKSGKKVKVVDILLVDDTGKVKLTLFGKDVYKVNVGDKIKVVNGYTREFRGELHLYKGRNGKIEVIEGSKKKSFDKRVTRKDNFEKYNKEFEI